MRKENLLEKANQFISLNKGLPDQRYRPHFHATAPIGWINDPNGFFFDGEWYHLFYQHYPYAARWNDMHWGHWRSRDLAVWEDMPVSMAPDQPYDENGCFSGTAIPDGRGGAHILYTGVSENKTLQQQCYAHFDGKGITKSANNPLIPFSLLPDGYIRKDFRDPRLFRTADGYRAVVSAKHRDGGRLICFSSPDLEKWQYSGVFCETEGIMAECPDLWTVDGKTVVLYSKVEKKENLGENGRPVLYTVGTMNPEATSFTPGAWFRMDYGSEFYATQTCQGKSGEQVAVSWMASWDTEYPTALLSHGWSGMMTIPRILHLRNGRLSQEPAPGLKKLRGKRTHLSADLNQSQANLQGVCARHAEIHFRADVSQADAVVLNLMEDGDERVSLLWLNDVLILNRTTIACNQMGRFIPEIRMPLSAENGWLDWTVYVDNCAVEVFAGGKTMSAVAFPEGDAYDVSAAVKGKASIDLDCWEMKQSV